MECPGPRRTLVYGGGGGRRAGGGVNVAAFYSAADLTWAHFESAAEYKSLLLGYDWAGEVSFQFCSWTLSPRDYTHIPTELPISLAEHVNHLLI